MRRSFNLLIRVFVSALIMITAYNCVFTSHAGSINSNEARVISAASGTFTYKGKTYKAYSDYVNELYSYLADDDVDLDKDQADEAISYIYSNVKEGIDSGYVYEVKDKDDKHTDLDNLPDDPAANADTGNDSEKAAKESSDKEVAQLFENIDKNVKEKEKYSKELTATQTDASLIVNDDSITINTGEKEIKLFKNDRIIPTGFVRLFVIVGALCLVINALILIILSAKGCMRFLGQDRQKRRKGHRERRRIRKVCRYILTVTTAVAFTFVCLILAIGFCLFNNNRIMQNIQSSGYFRYAYTQYLAETDTNILSYDDYIFKQKLSINSTFENDTPLEKLEVDDKSIAPFVKRMQLDMKSGLIISLICLTVSLILSIIANFFMDLRRDRGIKSLSISIFAGTIIVFIVAVLLSVFSIERSFFIEPQYLKNIIEDMMNYIVKIFVIIGLFGTAFGSSLVGLYRTMRRYR
ncbi:MAG: hypothetical protein J5517_07330 [Eubacterium sp.]|nr:hypothetical protein [Eubacterium sp.]